MELAEFIKEYFSISDKINKFNNSEITTMNFRYTSKHFVIMYDVKYFPYQVTDIEIANVFKSMLNVPFTLSVARENNKIWSIEVSRVFI